MRASTMRRELFQDTVPNRNSRTLLFDVQEDLCYIAVSAGAVPESSAYVIWAAMYVDVEAGKVTQVEDALGELREVYYLALLTGDSDISAAVIGADVDSLRSFITETIHSIPGARKTRVHLLTRILKQSYDRAFP